MIVPSVVQGTEQLIHVYLNLRVRKAPTRQCQRRRNGPDICNFHSSCDWRYAFLIPCQEIASRIHHQEQRQTLDGQPGAAMGVGIQSPSHVDCTDDFKNVKMTISNPMVRLEKKRLLNVAC